MRKNNTTPVMSALSAAWLTASLMLLMPACEKDMEMISRRPGSDVVFGASTGYENDPATKTEYSGLDESGSQIGRTSRYERIDWVSGSDRIRVLCAVAGNGPSADYAISGVPVTSQQKSQAGLIAADAEHGGLQWGTGDHYFYAMYPAEGMSSNYAFTDNNPVTEQCAKIDLLAGNKARMRGVIPAAQEVILVGNEFKANMNYAYMYAATKTTSESTGAVFLSFKPLVTTMEFTIMTPSDDAITGKLTSIKLSSTTTPLTGTFLATLSTEADPSFITTGTGKEIIATIPNGGVRLSSSTTYKFTLLALPVDQTNLVLTLGFEGGIQRTLELKSNGSFITVPACKKVYFRNLGVPGSDSNIWSYHIAVTDPSQMNYFQLSSTSGRVISYRTKGAATEAVAWSVEGYYADPACENAISRPTWLRSLTMQGVGSTSADGQTIVAVCAEMQPDISDVNGDTFLPASTFGNGSGTNKYYNLSNPTAMNSNAIAESANCYIVNGPGYYRIPLVMGNGVINNAVNPNAATYQGVSSGTSALPFKDYKGNTGTDIASPYLHKTGPGVGVPTSAHVVWEDVENLIEVGSNYTLAGNPISSTGGGNAKVYWLQFHVNNDPKGDGHNYKGNAVIAVTDENGDVMWSWHIWVTDYVPRNYPGYSSSSKKDIAVTNDNGTFTVMPLNLGWAPSALIYTYHPRTVYVKIRQATSGKTALMTVTQQGGDVGYNGGRWPFYQQGRKDALWPPLGYDKAEPTWFGRTPTMIAMNKSTPYTLDEFILNPDKFCTTPHNMKYLADGIGTNLWGANLTSIYSYQTVIPDHVKTIYDPCPAGYKVPRGAEFSHFSTGGSPVPPSRMNIEDQNGDGLLTSDDYREGWYFYTDNSRSQTIFFPSVGSRHYDTGKLTVSGLSPSSSYWYAIASHDILAETLIFNSVRLTFSSSDRRTGNSIRPVVE